MSSTLRKNLLLAVVFGFLTFSFVVPKLLRDGKNIVTHTYANASIQMEAKQSPYLEIAPHSDRYKYAPVFALLYFPFASLPETAEALAWAFFNCLIFWVGLSLWFPSRFPALVTMGLILCSMELNGPLLYQQINPSLIGVSLIALGLYKRERFGTAGFLLALMSLIKLLPLVFLLPLLFFGKRRFYGGCALGVLAGFGLPAFSLGWQKNLAFHIQWLSLIHSDTQTTGILDVRTLLSLAGHPMAGEFLFGIVLIATGALLIVPIKKIGWGLWISLGALSVLLLSPRTESPTFVFGAPAFLFLSLRLMEKPKEKAWPLLLFLFIAGAVLMTLSYNDVWPKALWNPHLYDNSTKTLGAGLLWLAALIASLVQVFSQLPSIQWSRHANDLS